MLSFYKRKDVVVTHTFSKIFGLASVRLGWAYCPKEVVEVLEKLGLHSILILLPGNWKTCFR